MIRNVKVDRISLNQYIYKYTYYNHEYIYYNQLDEQIKLLGKYFFSDNHLNFSEGINIYIDDLTEDKVKKLLKDYVIKVTWRDLINKKQRKFYRIIDYLE